MVVCMREQMNLVVLRNPFDRTCRDERHLTYDGQTIAQLVRDNLPMSADIVVSIDGEIVPMEAWTIRVLRQGEQMVVMPRIHDSGDEIIGTILMIILYIYAPEIAGSMNTSMGLGLGTTGLNLLTVGIMIAGSRLISTLMPHPHQNLLGNSSTDTSQSYAWNPATTQTPGGVIPRAYGRNKLYGNIISGYIDNQGTGQGQTAHLLLDLGCGPYSQLSDFQINDQPIGYYYGVDLTVRMGNIDQDIIPAFNDTLLTRAIGAKVVKGSPVTRATEGNDYDALEIVLVCPYGLWYATDSGGLAAVNVYMAVEISADDGATWQFVAQEPRLIDQVVHTGYWSYGHWISSADSPFPDVWVEISVGSSVPADHYEGQKAVTLFDFDPNYWRWVNVTTTVAVALYDSITLSGSTQQAIRRTLRVDGLARGTRYKLRCTNLSDDQASTRYSVGVYLGELNEVLYDDFQYPRTVLAAVNALATDQLSGSLKFSCMGDCAIVRVWDGATWVSQYSNNSAWVCWDVLTQPVLDNDWNVVRYDGIDPSRLILSTFSAWAEFCDVLVPDGMGGMEKRCTFNGIFDTQTSLWDAALDVCASARAQLVLRGTSIAVVFDDVRSLPAQMFTVSNTAVSGFSETWLQMQDRAASIEVNYLNQDIGYVSDKLTVVNPAITESSAARTQITLRGVTRASQVWREATWRLKRNQLLRRSASISVDIDALACTVGDMIWLQSDITRWGVGGRAIAGSTINRLVLDQNITLDAGKVYELKLRLSDDTLLTRSISTAAGMVSAVDVSVAFPSAPALYDVWAIGEVGKAVKEFLVLDVTRDGDQRAKLSLIEYNASINGLDSGTPALPTPDISYSAIAVSNVSIEEGMERVLNGDINVFLDILFNMADGVDYVEIYESGQSIGKSSSGVLRLNNVSSGIGYTFTLRPVGFLKESPTGTWQTVSHFVIGKSAKPADVQNFTIEGSRLLWSEVGDVDLAGYRIRFQYGVNTDWGTAQGLHLGLLTSSPYPMQLVPPGQVTIMIRAEDTSGNWSQNSAYIITDLGDAPVANVIESKDFKLAGWPGSIVHAGLVGGNLQSTQSSPFYKADASDAYGADSALFYSNNYDSMEWISPGWSPTLAAVGSNMTIDFNLTGDAPIVQYRATGPSLFYGEGSSHFYGADADQFYDPAPDWSTWPGSMVAKNTEYQFRVATSIGPDSGLLSKFTVLVDVPDKTLNLNGIAIGAGGTRLAGAVGQFNFIENIQMTLQGGSTAVALEIADKSPTLGPLINAKNSAGAGVSATIDAFLQGY